MLFWLQVGSPGILGAIVEDIFARRIPCNANANTMRQHKDYLLDDLQNLMQHRIWRIDTARVPTGLKCV